MLNLRNQTIIAIAPHLDDIELGCGGTVYELGKNNTIYYVGLSLPPLVERDVLMQEFHAAVHCLNIDPQKIILRDYDPRNLFDARMDILQLFYDLNKDMKPALVLAPNGRDIHQSHEVTYAEARRAFKYTTILGYELPWNSMEFSMDVFVTLPPDAVAAKVAAINAYKTQMERVFFANNIVEDLARVRGKQIGREFAECFENIRIIL
jgi:LmbE family N-acetylglucosaminyl deacetylase